MADEFDSDGMDAPQEQPTPKATPKPAAKAAPKAASRPAPKHKAKKHKVEKAERAEKVSRMKPAAGPNVAIIAVYVILGLLVVATSFYAGYLYGKSGGLGGAGGSGSGSGDALEIIEYSDYECPFCGRVEPTVKQLKAQYGDKINIVYKHFPLEGLHPNALNAAIAAECVRKAEGEDGFWQYHDVLFANQQALDAASLKQYASDLGFDIGSCLDSKETEPIVREHMQEGAARGVQGTPSFWIKDELLVGAQPLNAFQAKIDAKLSGAAAPAPAPSAPTPSAPAPAVKADVAEGRYPMGEANAPVVIVGFTDYECPFCGRHFTQTEGQIVSEYVKTGKVRYSARHFPLSFHPNAQKASEAVECAGQQGKFWEMHETVFENQQAISIADLKGYAKTVGVDTAKFDKCLDNGETAAIVQKDQQDGQAAGVSGTPSFYINGKQLVGAQPFSAFKAEIDAALQG
jgi:protein-disulfide isomerase